MPNNPLIPEPMTTEEFFNVGTDTPEKQNSDAYDARHAGMAALIDKETSDIPVDTGYQIRRAQVAEDPSHESLRQDIANKVSTTQKQDIDNLINSFFEQGDTQKAVAGVSVANEVKDQIDTEAADASLESSFVSTMSTSLDEKRREEQLFKIDVANDVMGLLNDQGITDKIVNYAGFLLNDTTLDLSRVVDSDYLSTPESVAEFLNTWNGLDVKAKRRMYPELKKAIYQATDKNNIKTALHLLRFIDPETADTLKDELHLDQIFLGADVATLGATILTKFGSIAKAANLIRTAKTVGREDEAAKLNAMSILDETGKVAEATKTDGITAQANGAPFKMEDIMPESTDGINVETQGILKQIELGRNATKQRLEELVNGQAFIKETAFTKTQKERIQAKAVKEIEDLKDEVYSSYGWDISDIKIADSTEDGFTLNYMYEGVPSTKEYKYNFKVSDVGTFDQLNTGAVEKGITSPSIFLKGISDRFVEGATNIELASAKVLDIFNRTVSDIMSGTIGSPLLHKKAYQDLDAVLLTGDDYLHPDGTSGKLFKLDELLSGVDTVGRGTVRLNEKQAVAYYRLRDLFDHVGVLKNNELRRTLELNGMKDVSFEGTKAIGKPFERISDGLNSLNKRRSSVIYDPLANKGEGGVVPVSTIDVADRYAKNFRIVRFMEHETVGNQAVTHALVRTEDVGELPMQVMHLKKGYVPKIYKEGYYFVKQELKGILNGRADEVVGMKTMRMFDSKKGAEKYMAQLQIDEPGARFHLLHDREMTQAKLADEGVGISGGLYTSPRAKHAILFNEEGLPPQRLSAFESLQRNLQHLSNYLPRNEWRIGMQQKWINTAREMRMLDGADFNAALIGEKHTPEWNALNSAREYIRDQIRIPTSEERWFEAKVRSLAEWAENPLTLGPAHITSKRLPDFARKSLLSLAHKDPFALARSTAFHSLLGWFTPAQLFVQAQGASIAMSLFPERAPMAIRRYMAMRPLMHLTADNADMATARKVSDALAKLSKIAPDELWEDYTTWRKTGLQESIKSTADYAAASQNFGFGLGAVKKVADAGLVFYKEGEMFTRGIAFNIAKDNWRKLNPGMKIGDEALKSILDDAMRMQLNLTRANRAAWQKGALSIPTQFLQIQTKFIEQVWPKVLGGKGSLTGTQKAKLLSMQFAIYGAAGIPFGNWLVNEAVQITGIAPEDMPAEMKRYLSGGVWDLIFYNAFGANVEVGRRGAVVSGIEDFFKAIIYEKAPLTDTLFGAFGEIPTRAMQAIGRLKSLASNPHDIEYTPEEFKLAARSLGNIVSTWRNIDKAILMQRQGLVRDKHGNIVVDKSGIGGFNKGEIIMQALGFQLSDVKGTYDLTQMNKNWKDHINKRVDAVIDLQNWYLGNIDTPDAGRNFEVMQSALLADLSDYDHRQVLELVNKRISNPQSKAERALDQYYKNIAGDVIRLNPYFGGPYTNTVIPDNGQGDQK